MIHTLIVLIAMSLAGESLRADPFAVRKMEQNAKAMQARKMRSQAVLQDFASPTQVSVEGYDLDLNVFPKEAKMTGSATVKLKALADLSKVSLDTLGLKINEVWFHDAFSKTSRVTFKSGEEGLTVNLPKKAAKNQEFAVQVFYEVTGDRRTSRATDTEKGLFFVNTENGLTPKDGPTPTIYTSTEPQLARSWFPCIDDPAFKAKELKMRVTVPKGFTVVGNGVLEKTEALGEFESFTWHLDKPIATYLVSLAIAPYKMREDKWQGMPVQYYAPEKLIENAYRDQSRTPEMIEEFSSLWGPYPYAKYATALVPYYQMAMEHTTATTVGDNFVNGRRTFEELFAHELAHHWWGDLVTTSTWDDLWLNEGFATYGEVVYTNHFKGAEAALDYLVWLQESHMSSDRDGEAAVVDPKTTPDEKFNSASYEKGGWVVHMLKQEAGAEDFGKALRKYLARFAHSIVTTADLKTAFEETTGKDYSLFFKQWVYGRGYPVLKASWTNSSVTIEQTQKSLFFEFPIDVLVAYKNAAGVASEFRSVVNVSGAKSVAQLLLPPDAESVLSITFDPEVKILKRLAIDDSLISVAASEHWVKHASSAVRWSALKAISESGNHAALMPWVRGLETEKSSIVKQATLMALAPKEDESDAASSLLSLNVDDELAGKLRKLLLLRFLLDTESDVRLAAAKAVGRFVHLGDDGLLREVLRVEESPRVKSELIKRITELLKADEAFEFLSAEYSKNATTASQAEYLGGIVKAMGSIKGEITMVSKAAAFLMKVVAGTNPDLRRPALATLGKLKQPETFAYIVKILNDEDADPEMRLGAIEGLMNYGGLSAARALDQRLKKEEDEDMRIAIKAALKSLGGKPRTTSIRPSSQGSPSVLEW